MRLFVVICLLALLSNCEKKQENLIGSENFELLKLGDGLYSCIHKFGGKAICNVGIVDNGNETIIFDTFLSPQVAAELLVVLEGLDLSPVKYVVNSHSHNDHIRGNQVFPEDVKIISTTRTKGLIEEWEPLDIADEKKFAPGRLAHFDSLNQAFSGDKTSREYQKILMWKPYYEVLANSHIEVDTRLPDTFVDSVQHFDGPSRKITVISKGAGHTESDLIMYLPDDKVVFPGDLVFIERHPYVPHGNIPGWKGWLDFMKSLNAETVIPGHGDPGTGESIVQMKKYLVDLEQTARDLIDENPPVENFDSILPPEEYRDWWFDRFYAPNLRFAYESLKSESAE